MGVLGRREWVIAGRCADVRGHSLGRNCLDTYNDLSSHLYCYQQKIGTGTHLLAIIG